MDFTWSATSGRGSVARTIAPRLLAAPIAARPGNAGAGDQDLRRRNLARRGHLTREKPAELVGGLDDGPVAGDVRHRTQHIHRLRPRDPRHRIQRQRRDRTRRQCLHQLRPQARAQRSRSASHPSARRPISSSVGGLIRSTTSLPHASSAPTISAPASA